MIAHHPSFNYRTLLLLLTCALPFYSFATPSESQQSASEENIATRSEALRPHMTRQQRLSMLQAQQIIEAGESEVRSGTYLIERKASSLKPDEDLKPSHEQGKKMIESGQAKIAEGQRALNELLSEVENVRTLQAATTSLKFNYSPTQKDLTSALNDAAETTLKACRDARYQHIFFDGLNIIKKDGLTAANPSLRDSAYDIFIKEDGTHFNVTVPIELKLIASEAPNGATLSYENSSVFGDDKIALLAIEIIAEPSDSAPVLLVRALDWKTQTIISSSLTYLSSGTELFELAEETAESTTEENTPEPTPPAIPEKVLISDENLLIDGFASLPKPYFFQLTTPKIENAAEALTVQALVADSILRKSNLIIVDNDYIRRTYLEGDATPNTVTSTATATLEISPNNRSQEGYTIVARGHNSDRIIAVGSLHLQFPEIVVSE